LIFVGIDAKIKQAKQHIDEFEREAAGLTEPDAYTLFAYCELDTRQGILAINTNPAKLTDLSTIIGDALNNLRGALDHLFHRLLDRHKLDCSWRLLLPDG